MPAAAFTRSAGAERKVAAYAIGACVRCRYGKATATETIKKKVTVRAAKATTKTSAGLAPLPLTLL